MAVTPNRSPGLTPTGKPVLLTSVLKRAGKLVVVAMLSLSLGLHWALLQTVAWAGMVAHYSQRSPLSTALKATFDGQHPCALCAMVKSGKAAESQTERDLGGWVKKLEGPSLVVLNSFFAPHAIEWQPQGFIAPMQPRAEPPPLLPPRPS